MYSDPIFCFLVSDVTLNVSEWTTVLSLPCKSGTGLILCYCMDSMEISAFHLTVSLSSHYFKLLFSFLANTVSTPRRIGHEYARRASGNGC